MEFVTTKGLCPNSNEEEVVTIRYTESGLTSEHRKVGVSCSFDGYCDTPCPMFVKAKEFI